MFFFLSSGFLWDEFLKCTFFRHRRFGGRKLLACWSKQEESKLNIIKHNFKIKNKEKYSGGNKTVEYDFLNVV